MTEQVMVIKTGRNIDYLKNLLAQGYKISISSNDNYILISICGNLFSKIFLTFNVL
jgi:hypothetical protein|nr:MAG TPA: hypothetical protein [Caudoviricetes sp.]